jgi:outer membrane protein, heavy metal efflux system
VTVVRCALLGLLAAVTGCRHVAPAPLDPEQRAAAFEARSLAAEDLHAFLATALGRDLAWPAARWDADALATAALYFSPSLAAARARAESAGAAIETARARPNPTLALTPEHVSNPVSGVSPWIAAIHFDWPIETAGKRGHRIDRARASATAAAFALRTEAWAIRHAVTTALLDVVAARRRIASLTREVEGGRALAALADARVAQGAAAAGDAAPFRLAWLQGERELGAERARERSAVGALAAAVGVPARAFDAVELVAPSTATPLATATRAASLRQALFERADVLAALADYAAAEAALRLELARQWPDLHLGPGYQFDQGVDKWSLGLSLELPVLNRNDGPIGEAIGARAEAAVAFDALQARVVAEVEQAVARRDAAMAEEQRLAALARESRAGLERARTAARLGAVDRIAELAADVEWLRAERGRGDAELAALQSVVDLEAAVQPAAVGPPIGVVADAEGAAP